MLKKKISISLIIIFFLLTLIFIIPHDKVYIIENVLNPNEFVINGKTHKLVGFESFDSYFSQRNKDLAKNLNISEEEAFILGNLAKYWSANHMKGRKVLKKNNEDLVFMKHSYKESFKYSGYCLIDSKPVSEKMFQDKLKSIKRANYKLLDLKSNKVYSYKSPEAKTLTDYIILRNSHIKNLGFQPEKQSIITPKKILDNGKIKIILSDSTVNLSPKKDCSTLVCKEILKNINNAQSTIDIAIYGYSRIDDIEKALESALERGVKIRLVYDRDKQGRNIYPHTDSLVNLIKSNKSDYESLEAQNIMHNKFYIFDEKILITGSANLSNTDMSGFNSNSIIVIESLELAKIYKNEFEQMYNGKFHNEKNSFSKTPLTIGKTKINVYFSPQDKALTNAVLPLIKQAKKYIYIPTFVLTEKRVTDELIKAQNRGVEIKILIDALNASIKHSKHKDLRKSGIKVKTENHAGKMHSKSMIIDDKYTIIGSMNFSNSGENKNDENLIVIEDSDITKFYKIFFNYQWVKIDDKWLKLNARAEGKDSIGSCTDGLDNNYDGFTDSEDPACKSS